MSLDNYWKDRSPLSQSDWDNKSYFLQSYRESLSHPHRQQIIDALKETEFDSLLEVGCCNAPNLVRIRQAFPLTWLYGMDINEPAIQDAKSWLQAAFTVCELPQIEMEDKVVDVVLADACLMYVGDIDKALDEVKRVARKKIIIIDWFTESEERINHSLTRNWKKRLQDKGFVNINIKPVIWPNDNWKKYGRFITAQVA